MPIWPTTAWMRAGNGAGTGACCESSASWNDCSLAVSRLKPAVVAFAMLFAITSWYFQADSMALKDV